MPSQNQYHPLPSEGCLTINDIMKEKGHPAGSNLSLKTLALGIQTGGDGIELNRDPLVNSEAAIALIEKTAPYTNLDDYPYAISDWYGYSQITPFSWGYEDYELEFDQLDLFQLTRTEYNNYLPSGIDAITRIDSRQRVMFNVVRDNETGINTWQLNEEVPTVATTPVENGTLSVITDSRKTSSVNIYQDCTVERVVVRINTTDFPNYSLELANEESAWNQHHQLYAVTLRIDGLSKTIDDYLASSTTDHPLYLWIYQYVPKITYNESTLTYDHEITTENWKPVKSACYGNGNNWISYQGSLTTISFNIRVDYIKRNYSIASLENYIYLLLCFRFYDKEGQIWFGENLVNNDDSTMNTSSNWQELVGGLGSGSTFSLTKAVEAPHLPSSESGYNTGYATSYPFYDSHAECLELSYYSPNTDAGKDDHSLAALLPYTAVNNWSTESANYLDPEGTSVDYYTIFFDYMWIVQPYEYFMLYSQLGFPIKSPVYNIGFSTRESVCRINNEKLGSSFVFWRGFFQELYKFDWRPAVYSERISDPDGLNRGIALYMLYNDWGALVANAGNVGNFKLYMDNFGIYKSLNRLEQTFTFKLNDNPLKLQFRFKNTLDTIVAKAASEITTNSFVSGGEFHYSRHSTPKSWGIIFKANSSPTYANNDGIYEEIPTSKPNERILIEDFDTPTIIGLAQNTTYWIKAFIQTWATSGTPQGYSYSAAISFTTFGVPTVGTYGSSNVDPFGARLSGAIEDNGNPPTILQAGFYWFKGTSGDPTSSDNIAPSSDLSGGFYVDIILDGSYSTQYRFAAFATNATGTHIGETMSFVTPGPL